MTTEEKPTVIIPLSIADESSSQWQPIVGTETKDVIERSQLPKEAGEAIVDSAVSILSRCINPMNQQSDPNTGLVVGYVQSGKTLSFTTVMALAQDNGFGLAIVIAGISKALLDQSTNRLRKDLDIDNIEGFSCWSIFTNPTNTDSFRRAIQTDFEERCDPEVPAVESPMVLITVMKNHQHLANLVDLLRVLDLDDIPTLIIDDEADQASLNIQVNRNEVSSTYARIRELRQAIPNHTFLQYTATPQAPLLINIIDSLSPEFVEILEPGEHYVGGHKFFHDESSLVETIPQDEVINDHGDPFFEPPQSLLRALRIFVVGVTAGLIQGRSKTNPNRSMLVHPSRTTALHENFRQSLEWIFEDWRGLVKLPEGDSDRTDFIDDFQEAYDNLHKTAQNLPSFDEIISYLPRAIRKIRIEEVNSRQESGTPIISWSASYGWILVGGQAMDRGFTVEGLTVTYMSRGPGMMNVDTIQQRGRFFGYKRPYLGYCRVFLEPGVEMAFREYVTHEEEMRLQLQNWRSTNRPLSEWKRAFILSPKLRLCRRNVIQSSITRGNYANRWFIPTIVLGAGYVVETNRELVEGILKDLTFETDQGNPNREPAQTHKVKQDLSLVEIVEKLLIPLVFSSVRDTSEMTGVLLQLSHALENNEDEQCAVYLMSHNFQRVRSVDSNGKISNLFQGEFPVDPIEIRGTIYPGDRKIHKPDEVTIQIHSLDLIQDKVKIAKNVPVIAIWIPKRMEMSWATQVQSV